MSEKSKKMLIKNRISTPIISKKVVLKFRSVNNIVIPPAKTGNDNNRRTAVIKTAQTKRGKRVKNKPRVRIFKIVEIKLIAPNIEETPARCKLNIARSTAAPECAILLDKGG
jgi:hypothetical protein